MLKLSDMKNVEITYSELKYAHTTDTSGELELISSVKTTSCGDILSEELPITGMSCNVSIIFFDQKS